MKTKIFTILFLIVLRILLVASQSSNGRIIAVEWSPDGDYIAVVYSGVVEVIETSSSQTIFTHLDTSISDFAWSPNSDMLAISIGYGEGTVKIIDLQTGNVSASFQGGDRIVSIAWNPDGVTLAAGVAENTGNAAEYWLQIWNISTGDVERFRYGRNDDIEWNSTGTQIASASDVAAASIEELSTGSLIYLEDQNVNSISWHPYDAVVAIGNEAGEIKVWDINTATVTETFATNSEVDSVNWSPNGNYIASAAGRQLDVWNVSTGLNVLSIPTQKVVVDIAWSPDGSEIAYGGGTDGGTLVIIPAPNTVVCDHDIPASDTTTLISSITTANGSGSPTTICLADDSTYTLTTENNILNGLPIITGDITIEGNNAIITRDVNAPDFHFFEVVTGAKLTLNDLTLSNGDVSGDSERGGALMNDGGETTLNNVTFDGNAAGTGGAIDNEDGLVTINDSTFTNNVAAYGGAIDNDPTATTIVTGSTFTTNHADFNGGAIHNDGGTLTVSSTAFTTNTADDYGGGIDNDEGDVTLNASTFTSNSSDGGGAIRNDGTLTINAGSAFNTNAANNLGWGGAIYNKSGTTLIINATSFDGNTANDTGGAIRNQGDLTVNAGSSFDGNSAVDYGGAIYNTGGTVDLTGVQITNNIATSKDAGGVYVNSSGSLTITDSTFDGNDSGRRGGGIWSGGSATLTNVHITNNTAAVDGGGVYGSSGATISAGNSCISGNSSRAVYSASSSNQNFENNWWGATDGPSGSGSGSGDGVNSKIDYDPFITTSCPLS